MAVTSSTPPATRDALDAYGPLGRSAWMDIDWRDHLRWVTVGADQVNVVDIGEGPAVVFIHGLGGMWQNWLENLPEFARDHRVIAVDLPGFGASPMPAGRISITGYAELLDRLLGALDVRAAAVVGNSMGGFVAAELALRHPERVERLVLVSAAGISSEDAYRPELMAALYRAEGVFTRLTTGLAKHSRQFATRRRLRTFAFGSVAAAPELLPPPLVAEQVAGAGRPGFLPALEAIVRYPLRARLSEIVCPTLIVWGTRDLIVPVRDADHFETLIDDSRKLIYKGTGHVPMIERPARFNADLRAFLEEEPGEVEPSGPTLR